MSFNQSRSSKKDTLHRKSGRSASFNQQRTSSGAHGKAGGGAGPAPSPSSSFSSKPSFKKFNNAQGGQSRGSIPPLHSSDSNSVSASQNLKNGGHVQPPLQVASNAPKRSEPSVTQRSNRAVPKAPTSQPGTVNSDTASPTTPSKGPGDASKAFPFKFGSISSGFMNGMQVPTRTCSAPPNLDEQKHDQAHYDTFRAVPQLSIPTPKQQLSSKEGGAVSSPGRVIERSNSAAQIDHRGGGMCGGDRWSKLHGPFGSGRDLHVDIGFAGNVGFRPGQGGKYGALRNPQAQTPVQCAGGILSGPMQSMSAEGIIQRINSDADRWQRATNFQQKGLIPSPQIPLQIMLKADKKYAVGKVADEEEAKQRQLETILNKLTPQNFEKLLEQVKAVNIDNAVTLTGFVFQIFDKAMMEPTFCEMYANFCYHLAGELPDFTEDNEKITFKRLLINKLQEEFERGEREQEEANKADEEGEIKQSEEERVEKRLKARRRMLGNMRLIGELYKKKMLTERIMHECIKKLLGQYENPDEEDVEALCELMSTIGEMIDHPKAKGHMDAYFDRMEKLSNHVRLSSRVRFILKDVIDLRKNKWKQRRKVEDQDVQFEDSQSCEAMTLSVPLPQRPFADDSITLGPQAVPKAPTSQPATVNSDTASPTTPSKSPGDASKTFPFKFGSISSGFMNGMQIPTRASSAPPNLDEQKHDQAHYDTFRAVPQLSIPTSKQQLSSKKGGAVSSPGRVIERSNSAAQIDHRGGGMLGGDRWSKLHGPFGSGRNLHVDIGFAGNVGFRPGQGGKYGALRNPQAQTPVQCAGGILSGPMQSMGAQGVIQRINSDADRWQCATNFQQKGLIPSPQIPLQIMLKADKKYAVGKVADEEEAKQRQLETILNKLTPQNFEKLLEQVKAVNIDNAVTLTGFVSQIFDKALMEPTFCEMYVNFCHHLAGELPDFTEDNEKITFMRLLLNKCQENFERVEREQEEANKADEEGEIKQYEEEREEKRLKARRRMLGNISLIGELYKKKMLTERIMHECIKKLLGQYENPDEEDVEALCELMSTIGEMIDHPKAKEHMDAYFDRMEKLYNHVRLSSRVRFILKDVIDLRKNKWQQGRKVEDQDVQFEDSQSYEARTSSVPLAQQPFGNDSITLGPQGGFARRMSIRGQPAVVSSHVTEHNLGDSRRMTTGLYGCSTMSERPTYCPRENLISRLVPYRFAVQAACDQLSAQERNMNYANRDLRNVDSGFDRPLASSTTTRAPGPAFTQNIPSEMAWPEERLRDMSLAAINEYYSARDEKEVALCIKDLNSPSFHPAMVSLWVTDSFERKDMERDLLAKLLVNLARSWDRILTSPQLIKGFESVLTSLEDAISDAPKAAEYLGNIFAEVVTENVVTLREVGHLLYEGGEKAGRLLEIGLAGDVLGGTLKIVRAKKGECVLNDILTGSNVNLEDFRPPDADRSRILEKYSLGAPRPAFTLNIPSELAWPEERLRDMSMAAIKEYYSARDEKEVALCIKDLNSPSFHPAMVSLWVTDSFERKDMERDLLAKLLVNLARSRDGMLTSAQLIKGFESVLTSLEDAINDAPKAAEYLGDIFAEVITENVVTFSEIGHLLYEGGGKPGRILEIGLAGDVLGSTLKIVRAKKGECVLNDILIGSNVNLEDFRPPDPDRSRIREKYSLGAPGLAFTQNIPSELAWSDERLRDMSMAALKEYYSARDEKEVALCIKDLNSPSFHPAMVSLWVTDSFERKDLERDLLAKLLVNLAKSCIGILTSAQLIKGFESVLTSLEDAIIDAPKAAEYLGNIFAEVVTENVVTLREIGHLLYEGGEKAGRLLEIGLAGDVLGSTLKIVRAKKGEYVLNDILIGSNVNLEDFRPPDPNRSRILEKYYRF